MKCIRELFVLLICFSSNVFAQNIAIIDSGLNDYHYNRFKSLISYEACFSESQDYAKPTYYNGGTSYNYYNVSFCNNGKLNQKGGNQASTFPRYVLSDIYEGNRNYARLVFNFAAPRHHDYVIEAARRVGANIGQIINIKAGKFIGKGNLVKPSNFDEGLPSLALLAITLDHIGSIAYNRRISVVSLSITYGYSTNCGPLGSQVTNAINRLNNRGIAVVIAAGNEGWDTSITYPSCLNSALAVGAVNSEGVIYGLSNSGPGLDFLARGDVPPWQTGPYAGNSGTSFATPRVATYLGRLKIQNPSKTMGEIVTALYEVGKPIKHGLSQITAKRVFDSDFLAADQLLKNSGTPNSPPPVTQYPQVPMIDVRPFYFGELNDGRYGFGFGGSVHRDGYGFNIYMQEVANATISNRLAKQRQGQNLSESALLAKASTSCGSKYQIKFNLYDSDYKGEVKAYLNNKFLVDLDASGNNQLKSHRIEFCGSLLKVGANLIEFRRINNNDTWGVSDIVLEFEDRGSINLTIGTKDTSGYGYGFGSNRHRSQLTANFAKPNNDNDLKFSVTGWDIDRSDETRVYLNELLLGFLSKKCSSCFNDGDEFLIESDRLKTGNNQITFIQRTPDTTWNGFQNEKWGVTDLLIKEKAPVFIKYKKYLIPVFN